MLLEDRVAIITGAASGMGRGIALRFADEGCSSVCVDLQEAEAQKTADMVIKKGKEAIAVRCDVSNSTQVKSMVDKAVKKFKKIDIMVNCAGMGTKPRMFLDITEEEYDKVVAVNMKSIFLCCQAIAPHLIANKYGKIVNIASIAAFSYSAFSLHYSSAKAGAFALSTNIALDLAKHGINVNTIMPGMIRTAMTRVFAPDVIKDKDLDGFMGKLAADGIPLKREGTVEDIASAAVFFASDMSSYITADRLCVGGGNPWK
jgi:NAD(P)-dependent dehydrogenase (short-subunit alcohol dehydrogenase family)